MNGNTEIKFLVKCIPTFIQIFNTNLGNHLSCDILDIGYCKRTIYQIRWRVKTADISNLFAE